MSQAQAYYDRFESTPPNSPKRAIHILAMLADAASTQTFPGDDGPLLITHFPDRSALVLIPASGQLRVSQDPAHFTQTMLDLTPRAFARFVAEVTPPPELQADYSGFLQYCREQGYLAAETPDTAFVSPDTQETQVSLESPTLAEKFASEFGRTEPASASRMEVVDRFINTHHPQMAVLHPPYGTLGAVRFPDGSVALMDEKKETLYVCHNTAEAANQINRLVPGLSLTLLSALDAAREA